VPVLKLRKVELVGFKSFCERTTITFSGLGMTCIVGPNGCGKSNVVDAISWVLGEQSHKSLRAERMSDCIFNGTARRPPLGLAEVTITLEDPDLAEAARFILEGRPEPEPSEDSSATPDLNSEEVSGSADPTPLEPSIAESAAGGAAVKPSRRKREAQKPEIQTKPGEVVVGRRLYRSGQSEYLLNGRVARLRDVQDLFMGMGLGPDSYAIIEQGRIGQILSSKPSDRRAIIEEAAGVTKYKAKKRLAEARLESSKVNLARVNDIVVEVEKQLGSLKRQASRARRYAQIREQMRNIIRQVLASKAHELDSEAERVGARLTELSEAEAARAREISEQEREQERLSQRIYDLDAQLRQGQNQLGLTTLELDRAENRIGFNRQRSRELETRKAQLAARLDELKAQSSNVRARREAHEGTVTTLLGRASALATLVEQLAAQAQSHNERSVSTEARVEDVRRQIAGAAERLMHLHGEQRQAEEALAFQSQAQQRLEAAEQRILADAARLRGLSEAAAAEWQAHVNRAREIEQHVVDLEARTTDLHRQEQETSARTDALREALASLRARRSTLQQLLNDRAYTAEAVQKLFAARQGAEGSSAFRAVGVLADYAEVAEEHEAAIEQFLRDELEYVVVETFDHARAGISLLRDEVGGRATFFVDSLQNLRLSEFEPIIHFRPNEGVLTRLDRLVEFRDPLGPAAKQFLPRLRSAFLVDSAAAAEKLARENPQYAFVLPDGTCYQGRMVTGGRPDEAGPLGMKRELRSLEAEFVDLERRAAESQGALERIHSEIAASEEAAEAARAQLREAERLVCAAEHRREQVHSELTRVDLELQTCQADLDGARHKVDVAAGHLRVAREQRAEASALHAAAEQESARLAEALSSLRQSVQSAQEELSSRRAEQAALAERLAAAELTTQGFSAELAEAEAHEASVREQMDALSAENASTQTQVAELTRQLEGLRAEKSRLETLQAELDAEWNAARNRTALLEETLRSARQSRGELRDERGRYEVERARNESDRQHLRETCLNELNAHPEDLIAQTSELLAGEALAAAETSFYEMKARVEAMGPVNMMALDELTECEQRFSFLTRERDDLLKSIADTQQVIVELDQVSRERFDAAFAAINASFAEAFRALFGGGTGEMRLTEPDSSGEAGIDVAAQPPGKRLQNVLLLSGGEKALAALALLIAIFGYQASPFCILDEVDAPLDEANVGRFTHMLGQMSGQTQFIVVTHNRRTMEMASALYGVTMQEPGVSKLVSVRWQDQETPEKSGISGRTQHATSATAA
jgi:chromosome segregation protein